MKQVSQHLSNIIILTKKNTFLGKVLVKKSSWSEHTWSTFISRAEEETEPELLGAQLLSQFQKDKFVHFFYHVLDLNMDHVISQVRKYNVDQMVNI